MLTVGLEGLYEWLVSDHQVDLLRLCPEVVLGRYVANTSMDSGSLVPTEEETAAGWQSRGGDAYSPQVLSADDIPSAGWDEWYIFDNPVDLGTYHLAENIFEVPQEVGTRKRFCELQLRLAPSREGKLRHFVLATNGADSPRVLHSG